MLKSGMKAATLALGLAVAGLAGCQQKAKLPEGTMERLEAAGNKAEAAASKAEAAAKRAADAANKAEAAAEKATAGWKGKYKK
jgi:hypothetical protein